MLDYFVQRTPGKEFLRKKNHVLEVGVAKSFSTVRPSHAYCSIEPLVAKTGLEEIVGKDKAASFFNSLIAPACSKKVGLPSTKNILENAIGSSGMEN